MKPKRILAMLLSFVLILSLVPGNIAFAASTAAYDGTPVTPTKITSENYVTFGLTDSNWSGWNGYYGIRTAAELYGFAEIVNSGASTNANAVLLQDIVINAGTVTENGSSTGTTYSWTPIGTSNRQYVGNFDGNGCTISGLYINSSNEGVGLFGLQGYGNGNTTSTSIKNVTLANSYICGSSAVGGIVGAVNGNTAVISNCKVATDVTIRATIDDNGTPFIGGIAGSLNNKAYWISTLCKIQNCVAFAKVEAPNYSGGSYVGTLLGEYHTSSQLWEVSNCYVMQNLVTTKNLVQSWEVGATYGSSYQNIDQCTTLSSVSDSHTCVSVTHKG